MENQKMNSAKQPKRWWLVLIIIVVLALIVGAFFLGKIMTGKSLKLVTASPSPSPTQKVSPTPTATATPTPTATGKAAPEGWKTYKNTDHGWQIYYPTSLEPTIGDSGTDCVSFRTDAYYVIVQAKEAYDTMSGCLRTGVGSEYRQTEADNLTILGESYTAQGMIFESASMGIKNAFWGVTLNDHTKFEYGAAASWDDTGGLTFDQAHNLAKEIVQSYRPL